MTKKYAIYPTIFGYMIVYCKDEDYIYRIDFKKRIEEFEGQGFENALTHKLFSQIKEYLAGKRQSFDIPIEITGTDFERKVYRALLEIPYGVAASYKDIATNIGSPKSCRAVGNAVGKNPLPIIIPCHRVITSSGRIGGYYYGLDMKRKLLSIENGIC